MFAFTSGDQPAAVRPVLSRVVAAMASLAVAGCASTSQHAASSVAGPVPVQVAKADVEDDGLPAQTPPSIRIRQTPDDPSEPYSRNYGGPSPAGLRSASGKEPPSEQPTRVRPPLPVIPDDLPPAFRAKLAQAVASGN